jgi:hypothetical protein
LEFETAEFAADAVVASGGPAAWVRATYDRPEVWAARLRLAADAVDALARVLGERTGDTRRSTASHRSAPPHAAWLGTATAQPPDRSRQAVPAPEGERP